MINYRVVLDTNVWIGGINFEHSISTKILKLWEASDFRVLISHKIISEIMDVLRKDFGYTDAQAYRWYRKIYKHATIVTVRSIINLCRDPKDNVFLATAVDGKADYLVSNDDDLLSLNEISGIPIIKIGKFYSILTGM